MGKGGAGAVTHAAKPGEVDVLKTLFFFASYLCTIQGMKHLCKIILSIWKVSRLYIMKALKKAHKGSLHRSAIL